MAVVAIGAYDGWAMADGVISVYDCWVMPGVAIVAYDGWAMLGAVEPNSRGIGRYNSGEVAGGGTLSTAKLDDDE